MDTNIWLRGLIISLLFSVKLLGQDLDVLPAASSLSLSNKILVDQGSRSKSATLTQLQALIGGGISATSPLTFSSNVMGIQLATTSQNGYLSSTDWNTFNGKQSALGFTAANDANVVHKTGTETVNGIKTFGDSPQLTTNRLDDNLGKGLISFQSATGTRIFPTFILADAAGTKPTIGYFPQGGSADIAFNPSTGKRVEFVGNSCHTTTGISMATSTGTQVGSYKLNFEGTFWNGSEVKRSFNIYNKASIVTNDAGWLQMDWQTINLLNISSVGVVNIPNLAGTGTRAVEADASGNITSTSRRSRTLYTTTTTVSNSSGSTTDYGSYSIPANTLAVNGDAVTYTFYGQKVTGGTSATIDGSFAGGSVVGFMAAIFASRSIEFQFKVIRINDTEVVTMTTVTDLKGNNGGIKTVASLSTNATVIKSVMSSVGASFDGYTATVTFDPAP